MRLTMKRFCASPLALMLAVLSTAMITGCAVALIGAGVGVGTAASVMGEVSQTYERGYAEAIEASTDTLEALKIPVTEKGGDGLKTMLKAVQLYNAFKIFDGNIADSGRPTRKTTAG